MIQQLFLGIVLLGSAGLPALAQAEPAVERPTGPYQMAWLTLEGEQPVDVFLALRDGRPVQFWSTRTQLPGHPARTGQIKLYAEGFQGQAKGNTLDAEIELRLVSTWAPSSTLFHSRLKLALTIAGDEVVGKFTHTVSSKEGPKEASGKVSGKLADEAQAAKADAVAKGQDWPSFFGQVSSMHAADYGKPLVEDLSKARPLWRSEADALSGWGTGADSRYPGRAAVGSLCGGSSSPIVSDGLIYLYHFVPSGDSEPDEKGKAIIDGLTNPKEKEAVRLFYSKRADLVVTCVDAATGKTVWQFRWPMRHGNFQTHKWRGLNFTPAIAQGILVVQDYSWGLVALDARTGAMRWSRDGNKTTVSNQGSIGPVISGKTVVIVSKGGTIGLDLESGKEKWKAPGANSARRVVLAGKERVLLYGPVSTLVDPADGKPLWKSEFAQKDNLPVTDAMPVIQDDVLVMHSLQPKTQIGQTVAYKLTETGIDKLWVNEPAAKFEDGEAAFLVSRGLVFASHDDAFRVIDLATGKTVKRFEEVPGGSNCNLVAVDDFVLYQPECQHGRQYPSWFQIQGKDVVLRTTAWRPPHNDTTAYGNMPITNVIVDGRLFLRGIDGLYCYDLRRK